MNRRLLVLDDSLTMQKVIRLALAQDGFEIQTSSKLEEALQSVTLFQPDVVLVNALIGPSTAVEFQQKILSLFEAKTPPKMILMSSAFDEKTSRMIDPSRFDGHLVKPFDPSHLRQTLESVLSSVSVKKNIAHEFTEPKIQPPSFGQNLMQKNKMPPLPEVHKSFSLSQSMDFDEMAPPLVLKDEIDLYPKLPIKEATRVFEAPQSHHSSLESQIHLTPPLPVVQKELKIDEDLWSEESLPDLELANQDDEFKKLAETTLDLTEKESKEWTHSGGLLPEMNSGEKDWSTGFQVADHHHKVESSNQNNWDQNHLEKELRKFSKEILPEIAEKIIREEIQKMIQSL